MAQKKYYTNDFVICYEDITCVLVNLASSIRLAKNGNFEGLKNTLNQLREMRDTKTKAADVVAGYVAYLEATRKEYEQMTGTIL